MHQQAYPLGPTGIAVTTATAQQQIDLDQLWRQLFQMPPLADTGAAPFRLVLTTPQPTPPMPASAEIFRYGSIQLCQSGTGADCCFGLRCGASWLQVKVTQGAATGHIAAAFTDYGLAEPRAFFQMLFFLLLRRHGYYILRANAVLPPPQPGAPHAGVLLVGDGGAGQPTLTRSLLQAGWACVGDGLVILAQAAAGTVVAYGLRRGFSCTPRLLLFPCSAPRPPSKIVELTAAVGMRQLLGQPRSGFWFDPPMVAGHFRLYGQLARQAASAQFLGGPDGLDAPAAVGQLLEQAVAVHGAQLAR